MRPGGPGPIGPGLSHKTRGQQMRKCQTPRMTPTWAFVGERRILRTDPGIEKGRSPCSDRIPAALDGRGDPIGRRDMRLAGTYPPRTRPKRQQEIAEQLDRGRETIRDWLAEYVNLPFPPTRKGRSPQLVAPLGPGPQREGRQKVSCY